MIGQTNSNTCRAAKLLKYGILFNGILTFLEFDYRDASPIILY